MRIYPGSLRNFDDILRLNDVCFSGPERPPADTLREMVKTTDVWIAREAEQVLGYAIVNPEGLQAHDVYLWQIAVDPNFRRRGIAGNILHALFAHYTFASRKKTMSLHVHPMNLSMALYFEQGFKVIETAKNFYVDSDGILMRKIL